ncbi:MAG: hypothetical protein M1817_006296 [Caeruleum heppii]|nr:MAG: hypothetical protein M1817_006296 [Caeruleum heppii]
MALAVERSCQPPMPFESISPRSRRTMWRRFRSFNLPWQARRNDESVGSPSPLPQTSPDSHTQSAEPAARPTCRRVVPGLPRPGTFHRQQSERRERLMPHELNSIERRALSVDRRHATSARRTTSLPLNTPSLSAPEIHDPPSEVNRLQGDLAEETTIRVGEVMSENGDAPPPFSPVGTYSDAGTLMEGVNEDVLNAELDTRWILNLSMHFRDRSEREKFFVTYAETPQRWRRVTVSCDYRNAPSDSLEQDLKGLRYQREKISRIYESIRESLQDIQFYNTVTNLKLQTSDGRLHVHVTEDVNEIIHFPAVSTVKHVTCPRYREGEVRFESHVSGFVYKVRLNDRLMIKKEIPGPDAVDEFLYEINALSALSETAQVIHLEGLIMDEEGRHIKGLLIAYAEQGALVDVLYDHKGKLSWPRRERWAHQIIRGLSEIHEAGFVQGDFTLSNIVVDHNDDAKIIDINRRGCPVGWEPPEVAALIRSNQRILMYIGVKSDLFQLGMVLWALAEQQDEPETQQRPLSVRSDGVPGYYRELVAVCLSHEPQKRRAALQLLADFPAIDDAASRLKLDGSEATPTIVEDCNVSIPSDKHYIDPEAAVSRDDLDRFRDATLSRRNSRPRNASVYDNPVPSSDTGYGSSTTYTVTRGRRGFHRSYSDGTLPRRDDPRRPSEPRDVDMDGDPECCPQIVSVSPPAYGSDRGRWQEIEFEGHPFLIDRHRLEELSGEAISGEKPVLASHLEKEDMSFLPPGQRRLRKVPRMTGDLAGVGAHAGVELEGEEPGGNGIGREGDHSKQDGGAEKEDVF